MPVLKKEETGTAEKRMENILWFPSSFRYTTVKNIPKNVFALYLDRLTRNLELLIIDDGSTDQSGAILDRLAGEDTRIRLIHQKNAGVAAARNRGIDLATGTYLTFVDGDDYVAPDYIQCLVDCARKKRGGACDLWPSVVKRRNLSEKSGYRVTYRRLNRKNGHFGSSAVCSHLYKKASVGSLAKSASFPVSVGKICRFPCFSVPYVIK